MNIAAFLLSMVSPLVVRLMMALGVTLITFKGVDTAVASLVQSVQSNYGGLGSQLIGLAELAGVGQGLGLILGAYNARVVLWTLSRATQWVFKP